LGEGAAQPRKDRVAGRCQRAESVGGAALDDEDEAAVGRGLRHSDVRRGEEEGRGGGGLAEEGTAIHDHLLRNSGATSSSASPWPGLSARAIACVVAALRPPGRRRGPSWRASSWPPMRAASR